MAYSNGEDEVGFTAEAENYSSNGDDEVGSEDDSDHRRRFEKLHFCSYLHISKGKSFQMTQEEWKDTVYVGRHWTGGDPRSRLSEKQFCQLFPPFYFSK
jgi:hypothetical protein